MSRGVVIGGILLIIIAAISAFYLTQNSSPSPTTPDRQTSTTEPFNNTPVSPTVENTEAASTTSRYVEYSKTVFDNANDKKRVYFFHAVWCPTCKAANIEFNNNLTKIPEDVLLLKTDYDKETDLKKKFNITYQHTFVLVDEEGNEIKKWNGGGIDELIANTK